MVEILSAEQTEKGESWYQGTADAVRQNMIHFADHDHDLILILSGDQLYRMDFKKIIHQHVQTNSDVTIAALPIPSDQVEGLGLMRVRDDLSVEEFVEKPTDPAVIDSLKISDTLQASMNSLGESKHCLASMGIYVFNRSALIESLDNGMTDFGKEVIPSLLGKKRLSGYIFEGYWEDIGTVRSFFEANLLLTDPLPPFNFFSPKHPVYTRPRYLPASKINKCEVDHAVIGDGCIITGAILKRCVIGIRSILLDNTQLENVVMMGADSFETHKEIKQNAARKIPNLGVGNNSVIRNAIIDKGARIGNDVVLDPANKPENYEEQGIFIRDGVLIVPKNAIIPNGTVV
jgi:glucose-1-phosphate adenylyltransferase